MKIYGDKLLRSSLWLEPMETRFVFIGMLAMADSDGFVDVPNTAVLAHALNIDRETVEKAVAALEAPDPLSRSPELQGRRIVRSGEGWICVNHGKYRKVRTKKQVADANRIAAQRAATKATCSDVAPEAEAEAEAEGRGQRQQSSGPSIPEQCAATYRCVTGHTDVSEISAEWSPKVRDAVGKMRRWCGGDLAKLEGELTALSKDRWLSQQPVHTIADRLGTMGTGANGVSAKRAEELRISKEAKERRW